MDDEDMDWTQNQDWMGRADKRDSYIAPTHICTRLLSLPCHRKYVCIRVLKRDKTLDV